MSHPEQARGGALLPWIATSAELVRPAAAVGGNDGGGGNSGGGNSDVGAAAPPLSLVDRMAGPLAFINQALVFESALDAGRLRAALAEALALFPTLACRAAKDADGEWVLCQPGAGAPLTLGRSSAPLARLAPACLPPAAPIADLGAELFGHLAGLPMDGKGAEAVPLAHVTLVTLGSGGGSGDGGSSSAAGCVLGLRVSHLVGDYGTLRGLLHHLARAYSGRALAAADVPAPGAPLVAALAAAPPPPGARQHNYLPAPPELGGQLAALAAAPSLQGLVLHVPPARLAQLKAQAAAEAAAAAAVDGSAGGAAAVLATSAGGAAGAAGQKFVSTNDALMAWLWRTLAALPCRGGRVVAFNQGLDMRRRLPVAAVEARHEGGAAPRWLSGNLATSAFTPPLDAPALPLGQVALALRQAVDRDATQFAADVALVAADAAAGGAPPRARIILPVLAMVQARAAGRRTLIMASQLALDYAADACFGGQLPVAAVCTFGRMTVPIIHSQPAPPAAGGGVQLYCWLPPDEAAELAAAVGGGGGA